MSRSSSFSDGVKIVQKYLMNLSQYEKNSDSLISMSAVSIVVAVFPGGGIYIASVFELPSFLISPQWTVNLNQVKCDLMSFEASSMSFCDRNTCAASSTSWTFLGSAIPHDRKILLKLLRIEMKDYHINMKMRMY